MEQRPKPISPVRRLGAVITGLATAAIATAGKQQAATALPFDKWPAWAKELATDRQPNDIGLGDTMVHVIGDERSEKFKAMFREKLGKSCGCDSRQAWLNAKFPYEKR